MCIRDRDQTQTHQMTHIHMYMLMSAYSEKDQRFVLYVDNHAKCTDLARQQHVERIYTTSYTCIAFLFQVQEQGLINTCLLLHVKHTTLSSQVTIECHLHVHVHVALVKLGIHPSYMYKI